MGIEEIRAIKNAAREPKFKKAYQIPKISEKKKKEQADLKELLIVDKEFYAGIWDASPHQCQCGCKKKLGKEPLTTFFHHLLPKSKYPQFRHEPLNIMILHPDCHNSYEAKPDTRPEVQRRKIEAEKLLLK